MQLMPKRIKFRKAHRGKRKGSAQRGNYVAFGEYGLMALEDAWVSARQLEAGRVAATHHLGKEGRLYIRAFPHKPISAKPAETRMGKGKGEPEYYAAVIKPGAVMYEIGGVSESLAKEALALVAHKMPIKCKMVYRRHGV
ncbi:MAG: 50S ribosomal protein L16 [Planctomycetes bacterium]|nr:50S ribosomal protein L16 [Planctomycetota bacterium]